MYKHRFKAQINCTMYIYAYCFHVHENKVLNLMYIYLLQNIKLVGLTRIRLGIPFRSSCLWIIKESKFLSIYFDSNIFFFKGTVSWPPNPPISVAAAAPPKAGAAIKGKYFK